MGGDIGRCERQARSQDGLDNLAQHAAELRGELLVSACDVPRRRTEAFPNGELPGRARRFGNAGRRFRSAWRGDPRLTTVVSRDDLCLMTPSSLSVRHLRSAKAETPFRKSGTDGSNPVPSSGESGANLIFG